MEIERLIYDTSATEKTNVVYPLIDFIEMNKAKQFLNDATYYKQCENQKGDRCIHPHCQYARYVLDRNGGYVKCGRK